MKKLNILIIIFIFILTSCGKTAPPEVEPSNTFLFGAVANENIYDLSDLSNAYKDFLSEPTGYAEDGHFAESYAIADLDNDGVPELIIVYYNRIEGGSIFANIYDAKLHLLGHRVDMYYKTCYLSQNPSYPGVFAEGGRNSRFGCDYWYIADGGFICEPLWTYSFDPDTDEMVYTEISSNTLLIAESKKIPSSLTSSGEGDSYTEIELFEIIAAP